MYKSVYDRTMYRRRVDQIHPRFGNQISSGCHSTRIRIATRRVHAPQAMSKSSTMSRMQMVPYALLCLGEICTRNLSILSGLNEDAG